MAAPTTLLYLGQGGQQRWQRTPQGWQALAADTPYDPLQPVWVVTDLAEESFVDVDIPRLYGRDRTDLIERQLATHFPDTPYRLRLDLPHGQGLIDQLAPTHHTLFGLGGAEKINAVFDAAAIPLAALCPISLLLTHLGRHKSLPDDLFIVLPGAQTLRIVVLKNRIPVLTRLVSIAADSTQQAEEIIRTHRYLENTRVLARGVAPPPVLILGERTVFAAPLAAARFELIDPPSPWDTRPTDWRFPLFDLAVKKQPLGQLAPIQRRTVYLAQRVRQYARITTLVSLCAGALLAAANLNEIRTTLNEQAQNQAATEHIHQQLAELTQHNQRFGFSKDFIQSALALQQNEILDAPAFDRQLRQIAAALDDQENLRLTRLEWRLIPATAAACEKWRAPVADAQNNAPSDTPGATGASPNPATAAPPIAEIQFELQLPVTAPRARLEALRRISARLKTLEGVQLFNDPSTEINKETLHGGLQAEASDKNPVVCLSLPGKVTATPQHNTEAAPS